MENIGAWDKTIKDIECHLNNAHNETIGDTPFHVLYDYYPSFSSISSFRDGTLRHATTSELWDSSTQLQAKIRERIDREHDRWKQRYDSKHVKPVQYQAGDVVFIRRPTEATGESTKLQVKYRGPLVVTKVLPNYVYRVSKLHTEKKRCYATTVHVTHIKGYHIPEDIEEPDETMSIPIEEKKDQQEESTTNYQEVEKSKKER